MSDDVMKNVVVISQVSLALFSATPRHNSHMERWPAEELNGQDLFLVIDLSHDHFLFLKQLIEEASGLWPKYGSKVRLTSDRSIDKGVEPTIGPEIKFPVGNVGCFVKKLPMITSDKVVLNNLDGYRLSNAHEDLMVTSFDVPGEPDRTYYFEHFETFMHVASGGSIYWSAANAEDEVPVFTGELNPWCIEDLEFGFSKEAQATAVGSTQRSDDGS